jgi:hypothetical protein
MFSSTVKKSSTIQSSTHPETVSLQPMLIATKTPDEEKEALAGKIKVLNDRMRENRKIAEEEYKWLATGWYGGHYAKGYR